MVLYGAHLQIWQPLRRCLLAVSMLMSIGHQQCDQASHHVAAEEAMAAGVTVAVCSTSNEKAVQRIVDVMLGPEVAKSMRVFAGDVVAKKKPAPDIYLLAAKELSLDPARSAAPVLPADRYARLIFDQLQPRPGTH